MERMLREMAEATWAPHRFRFNTGFVLPYTSRVNEITRFHSGRPVFRLDTFRLLAGGLRFTFGGKTWTLVNAGSSSGLDSQVVVHEDSLVAGATNTGLSSLSDLNVSFDSASFSSSFSEDFDNEDVAGQFMSDDGRRVEPPFLLDKLVLTTHDCPRAVAPTLHFMLYLRRVGEGSCVALEDVGFNSTESSLRQEFPRGLGALVQEILAHATSLLPAPEWNLLNIVHGDICRVKVDAIVSPSDASMVGLATPAARSVHSAAGPDLAAECLEVGPLEQVSQCLPTKAYLLPARHILHVLVPANVMWGTGSALRALEQSYKNCLAEAANLGCRTVAFPALGTGGGGFTVDEASECAVGAVLSYPNAARLFDRIYLVCYSPNPFTDPFWELVRATERGLADKLRQNIALAD